MAEFLIYNKTHWMDAMSQAEVDAKITVNPKWQTKYEARLQKGDIIEVREDGYWSVKRKGFAAPTFALVCVPGVSVEDAKHYMEPQETIVNAGTKNEVRSLLKRRRYQVDLQQISLSAENSATVSRLADARIRDKSG